MKNYIYTFVGALLIGLSIGWFLKPAEQKTVVQEKEIEVVKKDVVTVVKEVTKPDGTKETTTTVTDKSKETGYKTSKNETVSIKDRDWALGLGAGVSLKERETTIYILDVNRRIAGPIWLGVTYQTDNFIGIKAIIEF